MKDLRIGPRREDQKIKIFVNGAEVVAYEGETVLAALIASGRKKLRKSRQTGEPRGALCGMGVCYECLVSVNGAPQQRACQTQVRDGMEIGLDEQ